MHVINTLNKHVPSGSICGRKARAIPIKKLCALPIDAITLSTTLVVCFLVNERDYIINVIIIMGGNISRLYVQSKRLQNLNLAELYISLCRTTITFLLSSGIGIALHSG